MTEFEIIDEVNCLWLENRLSALGSAMLFRLFQDLGSNDYEIRKDALQDWAIDDDGNLLNENVEFQKYIKVAFGSGVEDKYKSVRPIVAKHIKNKTIGELIHALTRQYIQQQQNKNQ